MDLNNKLTNINDALKKSSNSIEFWINDPHIIFNNKYLFDIYPKENMSRVEKFNAISRLIIFLTIFVLFISRDYKIIIFSIIILSAIIIVFYFLNKKDNSTENFSNNNLYETYKHNFTNPEINNPLMNVMLPEIQDAPNRKQGAPAYNDKVKDLINESTKNIVKKNFKDDNIDERLFNDLGDKIEFENSMRHFFTNPNTTIPNNQKEFAEFCYGNMASCKDGNNKDCKNNLYEFHRN
jgi:uncharacterized membrane protein YbaN (DUF454 family)